MNTHQTRTAATQPRTRRKTRVPPAEPQSNYGALLGAGTAAMPRDPSMEAVLERINERTASCFDDTPFAKRLARHAGISIRLAEEVISGHKPFTAPMLERVARRTEISAHWLLTGEGTLDPSAAAGLNEWEFIKGFRKAHPLRQRYAVFVIAFDNVMERLPWAIRNRVLAGLVTIAAAGIDEHDWLRSAIGRCMVKYTIGMVELAGLEPIFTPVHEYLGIFGPERPASLDCYLEQYQ